MKKLLLVATFCLSAITFAQNVRTSIMSGLGTNPFVWDCTCVPFPNDSIIINHNITLNVDFGFSDGAVVINSGGQLVGDSPMRAFAFTGSANFVNHGNFDVARTAFFGGSAINTGTFAADSFYTDITTTQGWLSTGDMNISTSYWNRGKFVLGSSAEMIVGDNFYNGDSIAAGVNAVLINDGAIRVNLDFANADTIRGTGQICIYGNSANIGMITGTLDMCDNTGGGQVDLNLGTITAGVTTCVNTCNIGINEESSIHVEVFPNPTTDMIQIKAGVDVNVMMLDMLGKLVYQSTNENQIQTISMVSFPQGIYTYKVVSAFGYASGIVIKN